MEEMLRGLAELIRTGDSEDFYRGWIANQAELRRTKEVSGTYFEPYDRNAGISDAENLELLRPILEIFGSFKRDPEDGLRAIEAQQRSGDNVGDVTNRFPGKYRTPFQAQISGEGFESLQQAINALVLKQASKLAAEMREHEKEEERKHKEEEERKKKEDEEREEHRKKEEEEKERDRKEREEKDDKIKELSAQVENLTSMINTLQAQYASPLGSRVGMQAPVPGGANASGVLQPTPPNPFGQQQTANEKAFSAFVTEGMKVVSKYDDGNGTNRAKVAKLRNELKDAALAFKAGGVPALNDPELKAVADSLGLPHGLNLEPSAGMVPSGGAAV